MNYKTLLGLIAASTVTGCVITNGTPGYPGDVTFTWSFGGLQCADVPQVRSVRISIPGETLQNDGVFPCSVNGYPGIVLQEFAPGYYTFTIQAIGFSGDTLYQASSSFTVDGNVSVRVDLSPDGTGNSYAYLMWTFPPNSVSQTPNCDQAGVAFVDISVDQGAVQRATCSAGFTQPGFRTGNLLPGLHQIELRGVDSSSFPYYRFVGSLQTNSSSPVSASYALNWNVGGASIAWQLINGSVTQSCSQAGVQTVRVNFRDANGNDVYGANGDPQPCDGAPILYNFLLPGTYRLSLVGMGNGATYQSDLNNPPTVTIVAGQFVNTSSTPLSIAMFSH